MADRLKFSVIIPTYRRRDVLMQCLEALAAQTLPTSSFEISVSDNDADPLVKEAVHRIRDDSSIAVHYRSQTNRGTPARNESIEAANGEIVLFLNDDTIATPTLLEEHLRIYEENPNEEGLAVLGRVTISPDVPNTLFAKLHLDATYDLLRGKTELGWRNFATCNISIRTDFLRKNGLFDESLGYLEDTDLGERLSHCGLRLRYNPAALGYHLHHLEEEDYLAIAERAGIAVARWYRRAPDKAPQLAAVGLRVGLSLHKRLRTQLAELLVDRFALPALIWAARAAAPRHEGTALALYRKVYQSTKRIAMRAEFARADGWPTHGSQTRG